MRQYGRDCQYVGVPTRQATVDEARIPPIGGSGTLLPRAERGRQQHCKKNRQDGHQPDEFGRPYDKKKCKTCPNVGQCAAEAKAEAKSE